MLPATETNILVHDQVTSNQTTTLLICFIEHHNCGKFCDTRIKQNGEFLSFISCSPSSSACCVSSQTLLHFSNMFHFAACSLLFSKPSPPLFVSCMKQHHGTFAQPRYDTPENNTLTKPGQVESN